MHVSGLTLKAEYHFVYLGAYVVGNMEDFEIYFECADYALLVTFAVPI